MGRDQHQPASDECYDLALDQRFRKSYSRQTPTNLISMSPSALSHAVVAGTALGLGYYLGSRLNTQNIAPPTAPIPPESESKDKELPKEPEVDSEEEDDALGDGDLSVVKAGFMQPCKLVLVVRTDLKMTTGKTAAQ
ncbi:hypothetical protein DFH29DRAFT_486479 [Suillus ampliporus]|nr:hypothetical protein DFH29DRAFT_486479 [Suillus ampliporus]